jgi:hypothetical protein
MSERSREDACRSNRVIGEWLYAETFDPENGVRKPFVEPNAQPRHPDTCKHPAHPSNRLVAQLNENWRVVDDPLQWILQRKKGNPRSKNTGWRDQSFCRMREGLLRCIRERIAKQVVLQHVRALPDWHIDWTKP